MSNIERYKKIFLQRKAVGADRPGFKHLSKRLEEIFMTFGYREREEVANWTAAQAVEDWDD